MPLRKDITMTILIIAVTVDKGTMINKETKKKEDWEGARLCIQEVSENGDARTYIAKAAKDFPAEEVSAAVAENGCLVVSRLLYDRFTRVVGYDTD